MKLASFPKFAGSLLLIGIITLALAGCGSTVSNMAVTQGNWAFSAISTAPAKVQGIATTFLLGGNLTQSGSTLSGTLSVQQDNCISDQTLSFTGTVKGKDITLTSAAFDGNVISVTASGTKDSLSGNYTITGGCADQGTFTAAAVPSISGTWNGTLVNTGFGSGRGISNVGISVALTQAASAGEDGSFALTGTVTYTGSGCAEPSSLVQASIAGSLVKIQANSGFGYVASLDSLTSPTSMTGGYDGSSDECGVIDDNAVTLTKQ